MKDIKEIAKLLLLNVALWGMIIWAIVYGIPMINNNCTSKGGIPVTNPIGIPVACVHKQ